MEKQVNGKTYQIDGGVIRAEGKVIEAYLPPVPWDKAPLSMVAQIRSKGLDMTGRVYYGGYFVPSEIAEIAEAQRLAAKVAAEEKLLANVPGLRELEAAYSDRERYRREFDEMMEDGDNDGVNPPTRPTADIDALRAQYPVAVVYLRAESWSLASHHAKAGAGRRALAAIREGQDYIQALATMEAEWDAYCTEHPID
jgi:hypothetical protein